MWKRNHTELWYDAELNFHLPTLMLQWIEVVLMYFCWINIFLETTFRAIHNINLSCSINTYKFDKIWERCKLESTNMKLWKIGNNNIYKIYNISIWHYCLLMQNEVLCILHYFGYSDHKFCTLPSAFKLLLKSCKNKSSSISNWGELQWLSYWNAMAEYILKWLLKYQWNE